MKLIVRHMLCDKVHMHTYILRVIYFYFLTYLTNTVQVL